MVFGFLFIEVICPFLEMSLDRIKTFIYFFSQDAYMKNYKVRQEIIKESWDFDCSCELCQQEKVENCDDFYAKYDQLNHEADKINVDNGQYMTFPESYLRLGNLYKDMYKLAKEKKASKVITE